MSVLMDLILKNLSSDHIDSLSQHIGESPEATKTAVQQALPLLIGGLAQNGSQASNGWNLLTAFLDKNHDGGVMDDMLRMVTGSETQTAPQNQYHSVLSSLLGEKQQAAIAGKVQADSGISLESVMKLLPMLAPIIVGALSKVQKSENLTQDTLGNFLEVEQTKVASRSPEAQSFLSGLLDKNNDGSVMDDVVKSGAGLLGKLLS